MCMTSMCRKVPVLHSPLLQLIMQQVLNCLQQLFVFTLR